MIFFIKVYIVNKNKYMFTFYCTNVINKYKVDENIIGAPKI